MYMEKIDRIKSTIEESIPDSLAYVMNPQQDGDHFESIVISREFEGLSLVKAHQLVMKCLKGHLASDVHALALRTFTPAEWEVEKATYFG